MRWDLSSIFLKILEEPPESSTLILLAQNPYQLLSTIVSRCIQFYFAPLDAKQMDAVLGERVKLTPSQRKLAAELAEGSPGAALGMDLEKVSELRRQALRVLDLSASEKLSGLFAQTAQLTKQQAVPFDSILEALYSLLADLLELTSNPGQPLLRNQSLRKELEALASKVSAGWVARAVRGVDRLSASQRRNINRQLGLDALGTSLTSP